MCSKPVSGPDYEDAIIKNAMPVEWDDDILRYIYDLHCECGGNYKNVNYFRRTFKLATYDTIECQCFSCKKTRYFPFKPTKIHVSVNELIQQNLKYIRI